MSDQRFDDVVIGAGAAGCALANRLSADGTTRVGRLEAGGRDSQAPTIMIAEKAADLVIDHARRARTGEIST